jgi:hypothetical protein
LKIKNGNGNFHSHLHECGADCAPETRPVVLPAVAIYFTLMINHGTSLLVLLAVLGLAPVVSAQTRADFLVVTNPLVYTIYNQYQQPLSAEEQRRFLPGSPFRIIEKDVVLGDQISRALKFGFGKDVFYLVREDNDLFSGEKNRSNRKLVQGCELLGDTVELLTKGTRIAAPSGKMVAAGKGDRLLRVFRSSGRYYVLTIDGQDKRYGWSALEPKTSWKFGGSGKTMSTAGDTLLPAAIKERVVRRIEQANESYREVFSHFNGLTHDEKSIPRWQYTQAPAGMTCTLIGPYRSTGEIANSTRYLKRDIETILLGSGFWLTGMNGTFSINRSLPEK